MVKDYTAYTEQFKRIFSLTPQLSNKKPSEFAEETIMIPKYGRLNYDYNPFCRKIIDCFAPDHPARRIAVMKSAQITFSSGVIYPLLGYIIKENPCNSSLMVGTEDLVKGAVEKLDFMIDNAKLRDYIFSQSQRKRKTKTGDTDNLKTFPNGYIMLWAATNPKSIAQMDWQIILLDDFEAMKGKSTVAGNLQNLVEMRAASNLTSYKLGMFSTPLTKADSNIEPAFLDGNQEYYFINCPCCHEPIVLRWTVEEGELISKLTGERAAGTGGMYYTTNSLGQVDRNSIGYVCYKCAGFFTDHKKKQMLIEAEWVPTGVPISDDYYSFHINCLYAPVGQFNWEYYCGKHLEAYPKNQPPREDKVQTLMNTGLALTYEPKGDSPAASQIMKNQRRYKPGIIPYEMSMRDGNGRIVMLTCAADLNGTMAGYHNHKLDDVRLDYEIVAWPETGSPYSIKHGSIGTFVPFENSKGEADARERWTYDVTKPNNVWRELDNILSAEYETDNGLKMRILISGIDCGHYTDHAYAYLDRTNNRVVGLRGDKQNRMLDEERNARIFKVGHERKDYYLLDVNRIKDRLADMMRLRWQDGTDELQPPGFMNFPQSGEGLYQFDTYFSHYEAEAKKPEEKNGMVRSRWVKKNSAAQNHFYDCRIYNMALKEILLYKMAQEYKLKELTWKELVDSLPVV